MALFDLKNVRSFADLLNTHDDADVRVINNLMSSDVFEVRGNMPTGMSVVLAVALKAKFHVLLTRGATYQHTRLVEGEINVSIGEEEFHIEIKRNRA